MAKRFPPQSDALTQRDSSSRSPAAGRSRAPVHDRRAERRARLAKGSTMDDRASRRAGRRLSPRVSEMEDSGKMNSARTQRRRPSTPPRSVSRADLSQRRLRLRRKRGFDSLKGGWRLLAVGSAAAGLGWLMVQPLWILKSPEQIRISGAQTLNDEGIRTLLSLEYPQSLLKVEPKALETLLLDNAPLSTARVSRQLLPPGLRVQIQERQPVALAELALSRKAGDKAERSTTTSAPKESESEGPDEEESVPKPVTESSENSKAQKKNQPPVRVLLDEAGDWVPLDRYQSQGQVFELPKLKVLGMREEYREPWVRLYQALSRSPVEVLELDWRDPSNLKLQTELGEAHLGPYSNHFAQQLRVLDRMRELPTHQQADQVDFIDLRSPTIPRLRMKSQYSAETETVN